MLVRSRRHDDATRVANILELKKSTDAIKKKDQHNKYNQDSRHAKRHYIDNTHDDRHRITEAIQDRYDFEIEEEEVSCSECIEFSLKKKFWIEWKIIERQKVNIET